LENLVFIIPMSKKIFDKMRTAHSRL
jgi:hypothetical protein